MTDKRVYIISGSLLLMGVATWFGIKWWQLSKDVEKEKEEGSTEVVGSDNDGNFTYHEKWVPGTDHFSLDEYKSNDGVPVPEQYYGNVQMLMNQMEVVRKALGNAPIHVNSGYRSPAHNAAVGGVPGSQHPLAKANDFTADGYTPAQIKTVLQRLINEGKILPGGIGLYNTFVHYDIRGNNVTWNG